MGRRSGTDDPDRFLKKRGGHFHYNRRVPAGLADLDPRFPVVRTALHTEERGKARAKRDIHERADNDLWAALLAGGRPEAARARYEAAISRAAASRGSFMVEDDIMQPPRRPAHTVRGVRATRQPRCPSRLCRASSPQPIHMSIEPVRRS